MTTQSSKNDGSPAGRGRRSKTFLSPSAKYEIYLQLIRGETTIAQAATAAGVDRSTILRIRTVGKEAALAALAASKPGVGKSTRDMELEAANAEIARWSVSASLSQLRL